MKKFIEELGHLFEVEPETPEETLSRFCKMVQEGKVKSWVFIMGLTAFSVDRGGAVRSKEDVTFLCPDGLTAPELRFIGNRLISRAEEMESRQDPRRFNL